MFSKSGSRILTRVDSVKFDLLGEGHLFLARDPPRRRFLQRHRVVVQHEVEVSLIQGHCQRTEVFRCASERR